MGISVSDSGPLFDGRAEKAVADACDDSAKTIATLGASMVRTQLNAVLRTQTPVYRLRNVAQPDAPGWKIWDQRMVYGPWLEGTGSRNRTTRFKGYHTYRIMVQKINARAQMIGQSVIARYMGRMN